MPEWIQVACIAIVQFFMVLLIYKIVKEVDSEFTIECGFCNRTFKSYTQFRRHLVKCHPDKLIQPKKGEIKNGESEIV